MENVLNYDFYMFENGLVIGYLNLIPIKLTLYFKKKSKRNEILNCFCPKIVSNIMNMAKRYLII